MTAPYTDNTDVKIGVGMGDREAMLKLIEYKAWLRDNNIKFSQVHSPQWNQFPVALNMRDEDAVMFKLVFGL